MSRRFAVLLLQLGLLSVVIVVLPYKLFELDRYFVPKELVLHVVALLVTVVLLVRQRTFTIDLADQLLAVFVLWSVASSALATNWWLAQRSLAVSLSSALIFWAARRLAAEDGVHRKLLLGAAVSTVLAAVIALAQAYGAESDYFSLNRIPGGTFGNRNFVAHFGAIGLPAVLYCAVTARSSRGAVLGAMSCAAVAAMLVLTRSRAAWLAVAAAIVMSMIPLLAARRHLVGLNVGKRLVQMSGTMVLALGLALVIPNRLNWSSDSPYLDSARGMMDYRTGSGKGRLAQYMHSMGMSIANPVFGVGPGNWPVEYVRFAPANDRSLADDGMTANPWPSSDWVAFVSERGLIPAAALMGAFGLLLLGAMRRWALLAEPDAVLARLVLIATIVATLVVSAFDAALLLAAPALLAWTIIGATSGVGRGGRSITFARGAWTAMSLATLLVALSSVARSAGQTVAIESVGNGGTRAGWLEGARWDPGSYRINLRVAQLYANRGQCSRARPYAKQALSLFPHATAPARLIRACN